MADDKFVLEANPHFYDYLHKIELNLDDDGCRFLDGAGQCLQLEIGGTYDDFEPDDKEPKIPTAELPTAESAENVEERGELRFHIGGKEFDVPYRIETGRWLLRQEVVWRQSEEDWPILIATRRWVFDYDPISAFYHLRANNLYYIIGDGNPNGDPSEKIYYDWDYIKHNVPLNTLSAEDQKLVPPLRRRTPSPLRSPSDDEEKTNEKCTDPTNVVAP
jgi:hypothetical protein